MRTLMTKLVYTLAICWGFSFLGIAQTNPRILKGQVTAASDGSSLPGVTVILKGSSKGTVTNEEGQYLLSIPSGERVLTFSFIGYATQEVLVSAHQTQLDVGLIESDLALEGVTVFSTGFQELPLERTTGSFVGIDQELLDRRVSTNLIDRLEDITPGLIFNRDNSRLEPGESISIRGTATLISNSQPLIVVDNLAYDGPLSSINPNDVSSMTVLKDAAAASIWGARAGNGVIVITTKKGSFESPSRVNLTMNLTQVEKPDLFYYPLMSINSLLDKQLELYKNGYYASQIGNRRNPVVNPLAESMYAFEQGEISQAELDSRLQVLRNSDIRRDQEKYFKRSASQQQYALNVSGGSKKHSYLFSAGWDRNLGQDVEADNSRLTLSTRQSWKTFKDKLTLTIGAYWVQAKSYNGMPGTNFFPYDRLADESGNPLPVYQDYSVRFKEANQNLLALDWNYVPLGELGLNKTLSNSNDLRLFAGLDYQIGGGFSLSANYQYWNNRQEGSTHHPLESYVARNLINNYTEIDEIGGLIHHVPMGGILYSNYGSAFSHNVRGQLNYTKTWNGFHSIQAFVGGEVKDYQSQGYQSSSYGYSEENGTSMPVDYLTRWREYATGRSRTIPFGEEFEGRINRFVSVFGNLGYAYKDRYLLNASLRRDASNLFGVATNQKSVPLWSAGLGWIASEEEFLKDRIFDFLKLRFSYGYNGNTNSNVTAVTTANTFGGALNFNTGLPFLGIRTPPNPELRWERIKIVNSGVDFGIKGGRLSGSLDYYQKEGLDLLGNIPLYPSSGFSEATLNYASTQTKGWDLVINSINTTGELKWESSFFLSLVKEEVTGVENNPTGTQLLSYSPSLPTPVIGKPLFSIFSFPFAGLDPDTGDPMGYVDGEASTDYLTIYSEATPENIRFHGSGRPTRFGAFRNTFSYRGWSLSANISYRLGYYFKRPSVSYDNVNLGEISHGDYERRWQEPGDEQTTNVPSDPGARNAYRNGFYLNSSALVEKGDHIRMQDVRLAYTWPKKEGGKPLFNSLETFVYINNLGVLWKATDAVQDPDYILSPSLTTFSFGLRAGF
ncbi:SusC/RagA family TonB-linked outer membrane protein [Algoriphagus zhangzhouensis]|uniref:TonB-linked outer membrane protein, SusC/RagA family n=1 Tax=Algoriphagus zhangzhouensis TaxID=1073327 RepID=A0A1M7ZKF4_9BACT|nr:SusC/RagA family TonB-linked outer membrane protein [Algoriphagus zhangzhouensis]TDY42855.1 TonB-linked SusC/RagA family outer membrane protein [Algoriphagus zhangzhouensis]SHO65368.1 TonB-linked outer membrane protein, SusC/RagA family [Algoriphagus zhangzhouensis]